MDPKPYFEELEALARISRDELSPAIERFCSEAEKTIRSGGKILLMGNGGSASDAQHIAAEFVGRYKKNRRAMPAMALSVNSSVVTSVANDYSYDEIFSRQIEAFARRGDLVVGISTSGKSPNVLLALKTARAAGCFTVGLLGHGGGTIKDAVDLPIVVPSSNTPRVQEIHALIGHIVSEAVENSISAS